jgi:hypothetical protein
LLFCCEILFNFQINKCIFATLLKQLIKDEVNTKQSKRFNGYNYN